MGLRFSPKNIYGQTAVAAPTLQLRLTVQIQRLKYKLKSRKQKLVESKSTL